LTVQGSGFSERQQAGEQVNGNCSFGLWLFYAIWVFAVVDGRGGRRVSFAAIGNGEFLEEYWALGANADRSVKTCAYSSSKLLDQVF
jgi:hypothetical protein